MSPNGVFSTNWRKRASLSRNPFWASLRSLRAHADFHRKLAAIPRAVQRFIKRRIALSRHVPVRREARLRLRRSQLAHTLSHNLVDRVAIHLGSPVIGPHDHAVRVQQKNHIVGITAQALVLLGQGPMRLRGFTQLPVDAQLMPSPKHI
jgi:hypothetical protein